MNGLRSRPAIVLPVVLMVLLIVEILATGTLALAWHQHSLARERLNAAQAQLAARSGAAGFAARWSQGSYQAIAPGTTIASVTGALDAQSRYTTELERLSASLFLVRTTGAAGPSVGEAKSMAGRLVAVNDISIIAAQFGAALTSAGGAQLTGAASVTSDQVALIPFGWPAQDCATWLPVPLAIPALTVPDVTMVSAAATAIVSGQPPVLADSTLTQRPPDQLGALDFNALYALADRVESGAVVLATVGVTGVCTTAAPGNWGAPLAQGHPCANYFPLIFAPGDLTITSGAGQGVLVVAGDLTLGPDVQFFGVVLARGRIVMSNRAAITGAAQAGSASPSLLAGGNIVRSNCALTRALSRAPALNRAIARTPRTWVPLY